MRRVLIVAYYFPPLGGIGSIRLAGFARHLPALGWQPTVLAPRGTPHATDPGIAFDEGAVVRARSLELSRAGVVLPRGAAGAGGGGELRMRARLRGAAHRYLYFPDAQVGWYPAAVAAGRRLLRDRDVDVVYSSAFPITAHLIARSLSRRHRIPWVAEFRDPWSEALPSDHPHRARAARLEAAIADTASAVVTTSPTWAEHFARSWGRSVDVVANGFDEGLDDQFGSWSPPHTPTVTHLGSYYPGRQSFGAVWQALSATVPEARVTFVGDLSPDGRAELAAAGLEGRLQVTGFLPHAAAVEHLRGSSMLLAAGPRETSARDRGWVPAKLFEYVATGLPVLFVGDPDGDAASLLRGYDGCHVVRPDDEAGLRAALAGLKTPRRHVRDVGGLSRRARARELAQVLERVVPGPSVS